MFESKIQLSPNTEGIKLFLPNMLYHVGIVDFAIHILLFTQGTLACARFALC